MLKRLLMLTILALCQGEATQPSETPSTEAKSSEAPSSVTLSAETTSSEAQTTETSSSEIIVDSNDSYNDKAELLIILGPPASGKSTISDILNKTDNYEHLSVGDILRDELREKSPFGLKYRREIEEGSLLPTEAVNEVVFSTLDNHMPGQKLILDGYPRTADQAETLLKYAEGRPDLSLQFIELIISDKAVIERATNRLSCSKCHINYNAKTAPPKKAGHCDSCGEALDARESDKNPELFAKRLETYHQNILPVLTVIRAKSTVSKVDITGDIETVGKNVTQVLQSPSQKAPVKASEASIEPPSEQNDKT